jgi:hypothetical protein
VEATAVQTRFRYRDGVLSLEDVTGQVPATNRPGAGSFAGDAQLQVAPLGDLTARLKLVDLPADNALAVLPASADARGHLSGVARARVAAARLTDPAAWTASADLTTDDAQAYGLNLKQASARVGLAGCSTRRRCAASGASSCKGLTRTRLCSTWKKPICAPCKTSSLSCGRPCS